MIESDWVGNEREIISGFASWLLLMVGNTELMRSGGAISGYQFTVMLCNIQVDHMIL